ncbi:hypothetical protein SAMN05518871_11050 [Psychrobacillus sp. OK028]|uniref:hypothetical protein n=1 Tax=Psychrobacillus sp. OK028 TaxID=1884359 RepID=UPI00088C0D69|nr:hypothetical protein [Psychrobacillus sp. OK028]SDO09547.1 hypothetical protein SAMN05518871_11050 [Psychrobacillus sp. OK028]
MKKLFLFFSLSLMLIALIACTSDTNEVVYELPDNRWDLSPSFEHSIVNKDGEETTYTIVGKQDTLGFTGDIIMDVEKIHKIFWFYFGKENILDKPVEVKAVKKDTEDIIDLHSGTFYKGAEVSPDSVNMPSNIKFPTAGVWKFLVYIDGEFYESIVVEVN